MNKARYQTVASLVLALAGMLLCAAASAEELPPPGFPADLDYSTQTGKTTKQPTLEYYYYNQHGPTPEAACATAGQGNPCVYVKAGGDYGVCGNWCTLPNSGPAFIYAVTISPAPGCEQPYREFNDYCYLPARCGAGATMQNGICLPPDPDPWKDPPNKCDQSADPVLPLTGTEVQHEVDFVTPGPIGQYKRMYFSPYVPWREQLGPLFSATLTGGWFDRWHDRRVVGFKDAKPYPDSEAERRAMNFENSDYVLVGREYGFLTRFNRFNGVWMPDSDGRDSLVELKDAQGVRSGWRYVTASGDTELYDIKGRLTKITPMSGLSVYLEYEPYRDFIYQVSDSFGRKLTFHHDHDRLTLVEDSANNFASFNYHPDGVQPLRTVFLRGNIRRDYLYQDSRFPYAITGVQDENGVVYTSYTFDSQGRVQSTELAGGVERHQYDYRDGEVDITTPSLQKTTYGYTTVQGVRVKTAQAAPSTGGCYQHLKSVDVDPVSRVRNSSTDFNSVQTTYQYNSRKLEISRTEAKGMPEERTITTEWYPSAPLRKKVAEPGRITEYEYDSHANVKLVKVKDTATQEVRSTTSTYVYNSDVNHPYVKQLTVDGPRANDVVVYDYDAMGNLSSVTQQVSATDSLVTSYSSYDPKGLVGRIVDPNQLVTTLTYTERGQLETRTVGFGSNTPQTTTYSYYNTGFLKKVTLPDQSYVEYFYDDAHRLTDIKDMAGNSIHYTLDASSNRTDETINDVSGSLRAMLQQIEVAQAASQLPAIGKGM